MGKIDTTERLKKLRSVMKNLNVVPQILNSYVIPTDDAHQNEYIAASDQRREFLSGFTGSAGTAVVTEHKAALWTDGRYFLQAADQLDSNWVLVKDRLPDTPSFGEWLNKNLPQQSVVGADPTTISNCAWETLEKDLKNGGNQLVPVTLNLVDFVWEDRPRSPDANISVHELQFSGKEWREKTSEVRAKMATRNADYLVITALDEIAWLLNIRGNSKKIFRIRLMFFILFFINLRSLLCLIYG